MEKDPRAALLHVRNEKNAKYLDRCRAQNIALIPLPADSFGVWEDRAAKEIVSIASVLATETGQEEGETKRHLFQRLSVALARANAAI